MNLSDPVMAALIGATATFITAMFQLLINARRQAAERAGSQRNDQSESEAKTSEERRHGNDGIAAVMELPPCTVAQTGADAPAGCTESNAVRNSQKGRSARILVKYVL